MTGKLLAAVAAMSLVLAGGAASADSLRFQASLKGEKANAGAHGEVNAVLDLEKGVLNYTVTYQGLSGPPVSAAFKDAGSRGPTATVPAAGTASPISGSIELTSSQVRDLNDDRWSFDIATHADPTGELHGVLRRAS